MQQDSARLESNRFYSVDGFFSALRYVNIYLAFISFMYIYRKDVCHLTYAENELMTRLLDY